MKKHIILIIIFFAGFVLSGINPHDYFTWILEVFPALIGFAILTLTFKEIQVYGFNLFSDTDSLLYIIHRRTLYIRRSSPLQLD
jgi:uncharacterized membrane protein YjdF